MIQNNNRVPFPETPALPQHYICTAIHSIQAGDTLYSLSHKYNVTVLALMQANNIDNPYNLQIGQQICIPRQDVVSNNIKCDGIMHTIVKGDTPYLLAKHYEVTLNSILEANPNIDPHNLMIGSRLCIPGVVSEPEPIIPQMPFPAPPRVPIETPVPPAIPTEPLPISPLPVEPMQMEQIPGTSIPSVPRSPEPIPSVPRSPEPIPSVPRSPEPIPSIPRPTEPMPMTPRSPEPIPSVPSPRPTEPAPPESMPRAPKSAESIPRVPRPSEPESTIIEYTVNDGDTLYMIAKNNEITLDELINANPNLDFYNLKVGMVLFLPCSPKAHSRPSKTDTSDEGFYCVQPGDNLDRICDHFQILPRNLMKANPQLTIVDYSMPGTKICIPG